MSQAGKLRMGTTPRLTGTHGTGRCCAGFREGKGIDHLTQRWVVGTELPGKVQATPFSLELRPSPQEEPCTWYCTLSTDRQLRMF